MDPKNTSFRNLYRQLPQKTREVIAFEDFDVFVKEAIDKYNLTENQVDQIIKLTVHVMVGTEKEDSFFNKIQEIVQLDRTVSGPLSTDISSKIIHNIDALHQKIQSITGDIDNEQEGGTGLAKNIRAVKKTVKADELIDILKETKANKEIGDLVSFIKQIPQSVQKRITSSEWLKRVKEIGLKYSLTEEQILSLIFETLFILSTVESEEDLAENIEGELVVSNILAEQLAEEIKERVITWVNKLNSNDSTSETANSLDIPPANLPGEVIEEEFGVVKSVPLQDQVKDFFAPAQAQSTESVVAFQMKPEPVIVSTPPPPMSFIANKLTQPTRPESTTPVEIPKIYTADPYREPIE